MSSFVQPPKLDPSAAIGKAFSIYREHASVLLPAAFGLFAIQGLGALALSGSAVGGLLLSVLSLLLSTIFTGAVVQLVRDVQDGRLDSSPGQLISSVTPVIVPLILVSFLTGIIVLVGLVLLIVPGIIAAVMLAVVGPVVVIERPGVIAALGRSRELVRGSGWQVFAVFLFGIALSILAGAITGIIGAPLGTVGRVIVQWIASSLLAPIGALAAAVMYLGLREVRGEPPVPAGA